jgi:putative SOS response-associated peptidase YedK
LPVIAGDRPDKIELVHWGLIPSWVKNEDMAKKLMNSTLNARIETAFEKPSFRDAMRYQRCIIPADSFYEWKHVTAEVEDKSKEKIKVEKVKYKIATDQEIFAFAGIWDSWQDWKGFSILTMAANPLMAEIHNTAKRMPVILKPENEMKWLDTERTLPEHLRELIVPYPEELMKAVRMGSKGQEIKKYG